MTTKKLERLTCNAIQTASHSGFSRIAVLLADTHRTLKASRKLGVEKIDVGLSVEDIRRIRDELGKEHSEHNLLLENAIRESMPGVQPASVLSMGGIAITILNITTPKEPLARINAQNTVETTVIPMERFNWLKECQKFAKLLGSWFRRVCAITFAGAAFGIFGAFELIGMAGLMSVIAVAEFVVTKKLGIFPELKHAKVVLETVQSARKEIEQILGEMEGILDKGTTRPEKSEREVVL